MNNRNLVVHSDGNIFLFDNGTSYIEKVEEELRRYTTNISFTKQVRNYMLDEYSLWSLAYMDKSLEFFNFLQENSINIISDELKQSLLQVKVETKQPIPEFDIKETITLKLNIELEKFQLNALRDIKSETNNCVIILPPRTGKTLIGLKLIEELKMPTLILSESRSDKIWSKEIKLNTNYSPDNLVCIDSGNEDLKPITICSYSKAKTKMLKILSNKTWGLIIYDDAHRLPADKIEQTNEIRARYKLGMAATLARYDNKGSTIFRSIGPKTYQIPWGYLEDQGYQKKIDLIKVRLPKEDDSKYGLRSKIKAVDYLTQLFKDKKIVIVSYLVKDMAKKVGQFLNIDVLSGNINKNNQIAINKVEEFNKGNIKHIICSKIVENLPLKNIDIMIALSYHKASEREETFRIGILKGFDKSRELGEEVGLLFSLVSNDEEKYFYKREKKIEKYGVKYDSISFNDLIKGDWK